MLTVFFKELAEKVRKNNSISDDMFKYYNVKRGLRNQDHTGVLVGLTEVSSVLGYNKIDEEVIPIEGKLYYRGYDIEDICENILCDNRFGYEEIAYLLLAGELPNSDQLKKFNSLLTEQRNTLPVNFVRDELSTFKTRNIMSALGAAVNTLYANDPHADDISLEELLRQGISLIARLPQLVAYSYRVYLDAFKKQSLIIHHSKDEYATAENFLNLLRDDSRFTGLEAKLLDLMMILHADHGGGNNSTFTVRVVSSTHTDTYSAVGAGIASLKGPLHGGANYHVMVMMEDIKKNVKNWKDEDELRAYIRKIIAGDANDKSGKVYGFGHAVYTLSDPRAVILRNYAKKLAVEKNMTDEFNLYYLLEKIVPEEFYRIKGEHKKISVNVDFYSGIVYSCLNIPHEVYTAMFAMSRVSGWIAHRIEEITVQKRIIRPAFKNVTKPREYTGLNER